jgi:hypothetical protein
MQSRRPRARHSRLHASVQPHLHLCPPHQTEVQQAHCLGSRSKPVYCLTLYWGARKQSRRPHARHGRLHTDVQPHLHLCPAHQAEAQQQNCLRSGSKTCLLSHLVGQRRRTRTRHSRLHAAVQPHLHLSPAHQAEAQQPNCLGSRSKTCLLSHLVGRRQGAEPADPRPPQPPPCCGTATPPPLPRASGRSPASVLPRIRIQNLFIVSPCGAVP